MSASPTTQHPPAEQTLILVGNPNVGKSVLFSKLTGKFVIISNYPGTTVEITTGHSTFSGKTCAVIDSPGVNELAARTEDARVTCDVLRDHPEATLVQVADAKNLRRALLLTMQLAELKRPMVLVLNMMDELDKVGGHIDVRKLSELLGIPVVPTIAIARTGIHLLEKSLDQAAVPASLTASLKTQQTSPTVTTNLPCQEEDYQQNIERLSYINEILAQVYTRVRPRKPTFAQQLGWWATQPLRGTLLLALILYFTFWFVGLLGAGTFVNFFENAVFGRHINPIAIRVVDAALPFPHQHRHEASEYKLDIPLAPGRGIELFSSTQQVLSPAYTIEPGAAHGWWNAVIRFIHDFLVGEYGMITMALSYGFAIVLPIVTTFFLLFSVLEDSGYLSRLAVMVNRIFRAMGLNGKAVLPMVLGLGCDTMATMTTRILETRKERVITTLLLALAVPCSAQLGVLMAMTARVSWGAALFWVALMVAIAFVVGWLAAKLHGGASSDFILELPPMRRPELGNVVVKTLARLEWYLKEVIPLFVLGTAILFFFDKLNLLEKITCFGEPIVTGWLGLPRETANAFLIGFLRRDYGAVYLLDAATGPNATLSPHQILVSMVTITLFMPCIATLFMIARELGKRTAAAITVFVFVFAFFVGGLVHHLGRWIGL
ncbi:MAG: ferrous iron transporter B [Verrucomicrobia bacterium]|nr:ferrous iron transporter B [Verrucomicrobiota bacterium]